MKKQNFTRGKFNNKKRSAHEYRNLLTGTVQGNERGFAFIIPDSGDKDCFVPHRSLNGAYHGDKVQYARVKGTDDEAVIVNIVKRNLSPIVGTIFTDRRAARVYPDDTRFPSLFIPRALTLGAESGQKVVCEITSYPVGRAPGGKVVEILGDEGELFSEELSIIRSHNLREEFPYEVQREAREVAAEKFTLNGRKDLRNLLLFTIDGEDTRDIDDAVSIEMEDGNYILGVHIADVSHYVKYGGALDKEAYLRGTSVYFPDRVLPMLPKELSNGACSLNKGVDRYAISCTMVFDNSGNKIKSELCESIINSRHKMTYPQIDLILSGDETARETYSDISETVDKMGKLCLLLEKKRTAAGSVNLDVNEAHIYLDKDGNIVIPPAERTLSHRIIEQFMISANESVAEYLEKRKLPCLYRVHEKPSPEKAADFFAFLRELGMSPRGDCENLAPSDFANILKSAEDKPYRSVVNKIMLRSMQKARYCGENLGHFGLASDRYCHFTSPIRRYPDLFVHRVLKEALHSNPDRAIKLYSGLLPKAGADTSECERRADEAERDVDDLYKLAYMSERLGEEFDGVISGVTAFGVFCELDNTIEGLIPIEDLPDDDYTFFEEKIMLKGRKHRFRIGDKVRIVVALCDLGRMKTLFKLSDKNYFTD